VLHRLYWGCAGKRPGAPFFLTAMLEDINGESCGSAQILEIRKGGCSHRKGGVFAPEDGVGVRTGGRGVNGVVGALLAAIFSSISHCAWRQLSAFALGFQGARYWRWLRSVSGCCCLR
jgi:hypothetical protein